MRTKLHVSQGQVRYESHLGKNALPSVAAHILDFFTFLSLRKGVLTYQEMGILGIQLRLPFDIFLRGPECKARVLREMDGHAQVEGNTSCMEVVTIY